MAASNSFEYVNNEYVANAMRSREAFETYQEARDAAKTYCTLGGTSLILGVGMYVNNLSEGCGAFAILLGTGFVSGGLIHSAWQRACYEDQENAQ